MLQVAKRLRMWGGSSGSTEGEGEGGGEATYYDQLSKDGDIVKVRHPPKRTAPPPWPGLA